MTSHAFLFEPGNWIGEGKITFSGSSESIVFYTKWQISPPGDSEIPCYQEVEMQGVEDKVINSFTISGLQKDHFSMMLENETIGKAMGTGVIDENSIAWEFKETPEFQGYEVYNLQENGDYRFHAEYCAEDQFRTIIDGLIWRK